MYPQGLVLWFLIAASSVLISCTPSPEKKSIPTNVSEAASPASRPSVSGRVGVVTFVSGDASVKSGGSWVHLDIGDTVPEREIVKTGEKSFCEIQFVQTGIIHLSESSSLQLDTLDVSTDRKNVDLELMTGSVTSKVAKLAAKDHFQVHTDVALVGVRGTKFTVTRIDEGTSSIAVFEGSVALMSPSFNPVNLENANPGPAQNAIVAEAAREVAAGSRVVKADEEMVVTKAAMSKSDAAEVRLVAALAPAVGLVAPGAEKALPPSVKAALDGYAHAVPTPDEATTKSLDAAAQLALRQTASLRILETLPARVHRVNPSATQTAPSPRMPLPTPKAVTPVPGARIDINKSGSIQFSWEAVPQAASYQVDIFKTSAGAKTPMKSWTTSDLSLVFDQFAKLDLGTFEWEVTALPQDTDKGSQRSVPAVSSFEIIKAGTLQAPSINKLSAPVIKMPNSQNQGAQP